VVRWQERSERTAAARQPPDEASTKISIMTNGIPDSAPISLDPRIDRTNWRANDGRGEIEPARREGRPAPPRGRGPIVVCKSDGDGG
jgi:hypothetical protein